MEEGGDWSRTLKRARIPIVSDQECTRNVGLIETIVNLDCQAPATSPAYGHVKLSE